MLSGLDLFTGIGGLSLALAPWVRTAAYCEQNPYCQGVLLSRMREGSLDLAPIWDDIRTLNGNDLRRNLGIDIIFGGFPCQDLSVAGNGKGLAGERSGLFFEVERLARAIRPRFIFLENVPAIRGRGADVVAARLACLGYDARWDCLSAYDVGAPHQRERWFMLAFCDVPAFYDAPDPYSRATVLGTTGSDQTARLSRPPERCRWIRWRRAGCGRRRRRPIQIVVREATTSGGTQPCRVRSRCGPPRCRETGSRGRQAKRPTRRTRGPFRSRLVGS